MSGTTRPWRIRATRALNRFLVAAAASTSLVACGGSGTTAPDPLALSPMREQFTPPPQYALWWEMTKGCSKLDRDVSGVNFYSEPASALHPSDAGAASIAGEWSAQSSSITLTDAAVASPTVVRHEMLHALIVASGHPADKFARDCAGFVNCEGACAAAVGTPPTVDMSAPQVETSELVITQRMVPEQVDLKADPQGWFALVVEVHNPSTHAVLARLRPFPGRSDISATLGYAGARVSHQEYVDGSLLPLLPGETKRAVYDLRAMDYLNENGSGRIRGFFNADSLPPLTLHITN